MCPSSSSVTVPFPGCPPSRREPDFPSNVPNEGKSKFPALPGILSLRGNRGMEGISIIGSIDHVRRWRGHPLPSSPVRAVRVRGDAVVV